MGFPNKGDIPKKQKDLYKLVGETYDKMKFIHENYNEENLPEIQEAHEEIFGTKNLEGSYEGGKIQELKEAYKEILEDDEESNVYGLKTQIENLLIEVEDTKIKKIDEYLEKIEGRLEENESGEKIKIKGLFEKIENLYKDYNKKLQGADTALKLAGIFEGKVREYKGVEQMWSNLFIFIILFILGYYSISTIGNDDIKTLSNLFNFLLFRLPFFAFAVWLLIFISNRRAESKKLEESYKHKEVMARAYIGYKESVSELNTSNNELLEKHMENLLNAMSLNSSNFLNSKGENHPFHDLIQNIFKKDNLPEGELQFPGGGKITFNK